MKFFVPITKVDVEKRQVWGRATQEVPDRAGEIFDYDSSKPLFEEWSSGIAEATKAAGQELSLGNVRAMHGKVAAGKLNEIAFLDTEKAIDVCAEVVDDNEWDKCVKGVYTGFSIGGSYVKKWTDGALKRFTAKPAEISLVDYPCVSTATFSMVKSAGAESVSFVRYGVLAAALEKADLNVGDLLDLVKEYLPEDEITALVKAESSTVDYLSRLKQLVAGEEKALEKGAESSDTPLADAAKTGEEGKVVGEITPAADPKAAHKAAIAEKLKKGMWDVSSLASLLLTISWMAQDAEWEKKYENDASTVPGDLRAWLAMGIEVFKKMSAEETAELIASITPPEELVVLELSASGDLAKKGARNSKADQDKIQTVHDHAVSLGASCGDDDDAEKSTALTDLQKRAEEAATELAKMADLQKTVTDLTTERDALQKRADELAAMPAVPKGVLRTVTKADDVIDPNSPATPAPDPKDPLAVMKAVHATGGKPIRL